MTLDESDKARIAGRKWAEEAIEYAIDQGAEFLDGFSRALRKFQRIPTTTTERQSSQEGFDFDDIDIPVNEDEDVKTANDLIEQIESIVEELPEEAEDFGMSVSETASDIAEHIEKRGRVTKKQITALENMLDGLQRWTRD
jgi:Fe-S cluster assembly scaffold protein SufB